MLSFAEAQVHVSRERGERGLAATSCWMWIRPRSAVASQAKREQVNNVDLDTI
jgi:hypothetical protein